MNTSALSKYLNGFSLCVAMGLFLGFLCGAILVLLGRMHGHLHEIDAPWRVALMLGFGTALLGWFIVVQRFGLYVPTLLFVLLLALAIAWLLTVLISALPVLQPVATIPGALIGLVLGKLACLLCRKKKQVPHG